MTIKKRLEGVLFCGLVGNYVCYVMMEYTHVYLYRCN
jgi:hypothetical protein